MTEFLKEFLEYYFNNYNCIGECLDVSEIKDIILNSYRLYLTKGILIIENENGFSQMDLTTYYNEFTQIKRDKKLAELGI